METAFDDGTGLPGQAADDVNHPTINIPMDQEERSDLIKFQLDTLLDTSRITFALRGFVYDDNTKTWIKNENAEPMLNEKGISYVLSQISLGKNILLSNYDKKQLYLNIRIILDDMGRTFYSKRKDFDIKDTSIADSIIDSMVFTYLQAIFLAAKDGQMRVYLQKQIREQHSYSFTPESMEKKKRFGFF